MHTNHRHQGESSGSSRPYVPKMSFPLFTGEHPKIWKDKCLNYFSICNVPESMWTIAASMHMDGPASKWLQVYKLRNGLGSWAEFIAAVEDQFGSYDYRDSIGDLVTLTQTGSLEDYVTAFVDLQYQVSMHNLGLDEIYFVTQFTTGLKPELRASVQSQVPSTMKKAILLATVQQQLWMPPSSSPVSFLPRILPLHQSLIKSPPLLPPVLIPCGKRDNFEIFVVPMAYACIVGTLIMLLMLLFALNGLRLRSTL